MNRHLLRKSGPVLAFLAFAVFWLLSHGGVFSGTSIRGYAEAIDHVVAPVQSGRVLAVRVQLGQQVKAGEVVAQMDTRELELRVQLSRNALTRAEAVLEAEKAIQAMDVSRAELQVLKLRATQSKDKAQLEEVTQQLARLEKLAASGLVGAEAVEKSRVQQAGLAASVATLDAAAANQQAGLGKRTQAAAADVLIEERLEPYREQVHMREAELHSAELALEEATLRAPADGTVSAVLHPPGDVVGPGMGVLQISNARPGYILVWLPERSAVQVEPGKQAVVRVGRFFEHSFGARVVEVSPAIEEVPVRARSAPNVPAWGRRVVLQSWPDRPFLLGEALNVRL